ncbi:hypothetical protein VTO73DRAFT_13147 [Trametes versicolor]
MPYLAYKLQSSSRKAALAELFSAALLDGDILGLHTLQGVGPIEKIALELSIEELRGKVEDRFQDPPTWTLVLSLKPDRFMTPLKLMLTEFVGDMGQHDTPNWLVHLVDRPTPDSRNESVPHGQVMGNTLPLRMAYQYDLTEPLCDDNNWEECDENDPEPSLVPLPPSPSASMHPVAGDVAAALAADVFVPIPLDAEAMDHCQDPDLFMTRHVLRTALESDGGSRTSSTAPKETDLDQIQRYGSLASKLTMAAFCDAISGYDIAIMQETHLRPDEELQLQLPSGYVIFTSSKEDSPSMAQQGGGVATLIRADLAPVRLPCSANADLLVVLVGDLVTVNSYLPLYLSPWLTGDNPAPEQDLQECLTSLSEHAGEIDVCVFGDPNARTASLSSRPTDFPQARVSPDLAVPSVRGRWLLQMCDDEDLVIFNGTSIDSRDAFTSFQHNGCAIVDYILAHTMAITSERIRDLHVHPRVPELSDHALLSIVYKPAILQTTDEGHYQAPSYTESPLALGDLLRGPIDQLLSETVRVGKTGHSGRITALYGPVKRTSARVDVWTDGSANTRSKRAGAGIFWGERVARNLSVRVPGALQTNNRAELYAVLVVLRMADPTVSLGIYSDSTYVIHSICHWDVKHAQLGWQCAHADLLQFICLLHPSDDLGELPILLDWPVFTDETDSLPGLLKVYTTLPALPTPARSVPLPSVSDDIEGISDDDEDYPEHKSATLSSQKREVYTNLVRAKNEGGFWKGLHDVFERRMNPEEREERGLLPALLAMDAVYVDSWPSATTDESPTGAFSRPFSIAEIEAVKAHLTAMDCGKARGPDNVSYEDVLNIPNEDLQALFQARIARCLVSHVADYLILTLLIDRRMREWADEEQLVPLQNRFRSGFRTDNNVFMLKTAIDQARANGDTLWVAFVDLTNAFPSVEQNALWAKLRDWGAEGPLFDWLPLAGILIGDPASPILWNLFFADFKCDPHPDDVHLAGVWVPYLAQADDILLLSTSPQGAQAKPNALASWCLRNGLTVNVRVTP